MNHKQKLKMARKMRTRDEERRNVSVFQTEAWNKRSEAIRQRVAKKGNDKK